MNFITISSLIRTEQNTSIIISAKCGVSVKRTTSSSPSFVQCAKSNNVMKCLSVIHIDDKHFFKIITRIQSYVVNIKYTFK